MLLPAGRGGQATRRSSRPPRASWPRCASSGASRSSRSAAARSATRPGSWPRRSCAGVPLIHVPTTLVAQIDSSIGGKTGVDLPEGKNLVGAFHQPAAVIVDVALLRTLPERQRRAALGEAVKMAALGDERLFELLEADGDGDRPRRRGGVRVGAVAELVERAAWAKVEVVMADERERGAPAAAGSR